MPRPRHQRQASLVLPPELIAGVDPQQILDVGQAVAGTVSGKAREVAEAGGATAAALQRSKTQANQEVSVAGLFPQLPKTPPSTT